MLHCAIMFSGSRRTEIKGGSGSVSYSSAVHVRSGRSDVGVISYHFPMMPRGWSVNHRSNIDVGRSS